MAEEVFIARGGFQIDDTQPRGKIAARLRQGFSFLYLFTFPVLAAVS